MTRRELLRTTAALSGGVLAAGLLRGTPAEAAAFWLRDQQAQGDPLSMMRAQLGAVPIEATRLSDTVIMLGGPGGNIAVLHGPDGKIVVDTFVQPGPGREAED